MPPSSPAPSCGSVPAGVPSRFPPETSAGPHGGAFGDRRQDLRFQLLRRCLGVEDRQGAHRLARLAHDVVEGSPDVRVADAQAVFDARAFGIGDRVEGVEMGEIEEVVIVGMLG